MPVRRRTSHKERDGVAVNQDKTSRGECEACGKGPRTLTTIDSGQGLCRNCLREFRPPRDKNQASLKEIAYLRETGFDVADNLSKQECKRLMLVDKFRRSGQQEPAASSGEPANQLRFASGT